MRENIVHVCYSWGVLGTAFCKFFTMNDVRFFAQHPKRVLFIDLVSTNSEVHKCCVYYVYKYKTMYFISYSQKNTIFYVFFTNLLYVQAIMRATFFIR